MAQAFHDYELKICLYLIGIGMPFVLTYLITCLFSSSAYRTYRHDKRPPLAPYWIPFLGHALAFLHSTGVVADFQKLLPTLPTAVVRKMNLFANELSSISNSKSRLVALKLGANRINFVSGADTVARLWRSKNLDATAVTSFSLKEFFSTPDTSMKVYLGDDSGINPQPHPQSNVVEKNRYYYQNRKAIVGFFNGPGLKSMGNRFVDLLTREITTLDLRRLWTEQEDLYEFIQKLLIGPAVSAMCGPVLLEQNPDFGNNFWQIDHDILYFFKGYPKWLAPSAYRNRIKLLNDVKNWHAFARDHFDESCIEADGHDRFYGSPLMRTRQQYLTNVDHLDADAIASQDLGLLWA